MGCLGSRSKIPSEEPGRLLLNTGIKEFDETFLDCEKAIKVLKECQEKLDYQISEFIRYLGAEKHYIESIDMGEATMMILTVLAVECKGHFSRIQVVYMTEPPFIEVDMTKVRRSTRRMMNAFHELTEMLQTIPERLENLQNLESLAIAVEKFPTQVAEKTEQMDFSISDKLLCIRSTTSNHRKVTSLPEQKRDMEVKVQDYRDKIRDSCEMVQAPPESDLLVARGVQGSAEGLGRPKDVVGKFWAIKQAYNN
jgi:hypothetical protein